jgi:hypothetical protein
MNVFRDWMFTASVSLLRMRARANSSNDSGLRTIIADAERCAR